MELEPSVERRADPFAPLPPLARPAAVREAQRCLYCFDAPCARACPAGVDVAAFIRSIATGNVAGAARTILHANPLGGSCAVACPAERLCEGACVRRELDEPVAIARLQRHAVDALADTGAPFLEPGPDVAASVAVVGAGPAGLACAAELRRAGVAVTLFESRPRAGGLADRRIVPWRVPASTVARDVAEIERGGARFRLGVTVGVDVTPARLLAEHDALVLAVGLGHGRRLGVPGEDFEGVVDALDLLERAGEEAAGRDSHPVPPREAAGPEDRGTRPQHDAASEGAAPSGGGVRRSGAAPLAGRRVGVIGGGSTAFDVAAAARRLGAEDVTLFYRRSEAESPAYPHAVALARALDVRIRWLVAPVEIVGDGRVRAVAFERTALGEPDGRGRRQVARVPGSRFEVELDVVVRAVGEEAGPLLPSLGVPFEGGRIAADPASGRTANPRVWAIGDVTSGGAEVVHAVGAGKAAARSIVAALRLAPAVAIAPAVASVPGVDLAVSLAGIRSPNPFWLASCPITNTGEMVDRAFDAGWGGVVWKTLGEPVRNVTSRLGALDVEGRRMVGLSNIELISDRPLERNLEEVADVKRRHPDRAVVVSLMVEARREAWHEIVRRVNDTGADGIELNFGCPHGMSERGMGAAVGQVPEYVRMITEWVMEAARVPVLVKLTPNVTDVRFPARAARAGGANGIALINTISSLVGVDLETWAPVPAVRGRGSHGGYSGPAVKPIALNMVSAVASDPDVALPISGIGGIADWRDAVQFLLVGATAVQVGTSVMHLGYRMIDDLVGGMSGYLRAKGLHSPSELVGRALPTLTEWGGLDQSFRLLAQIDEARCIGCNLCYVACNDGAHQAIRLERSNGTAHLSVDGDWCVGCRLCQYVCPVDGCISMVELEGPAAVH